MNPILKMALRRAKPGTGSSNEFLDRMLRDTPTSERLSTRALIARHAPEMVEDYDALIQLANIEFGSPRS